MPDFTPQFCPYCGRALVTRHLEGQRRKYCESCDRIIYQNPKPTAGVVVVEDESALLIKRSISPDYGKWGVPAGYLEIHETPKEAATRELEEETGLSVNSDDLQLVDIVSSHLSKDMSLVSIGYCVSRNNTEGVPVPGSEVSEVKFWDPKKLEKIEGDSLRSHDKERVHKAIKLINSK